MNSTERNRSNSSASALHAIVVGGGIAGMAAAAALAKHYDHVTVIEADNLAESGLFGRKGVPQSRYAHALLRGGELALEALFPGFGSALLARGALRLDMNHRFAFCRSQGWSPSLPCGLELYWCSRGLTEQTVRAQLKGSPRVHWLEAARVTELVTERTADRPRATGVRVRRADGSTESLAAQLVVDASGRSTQSLRWLAQLGCAPVEEEKVDAHLSYVGRWYRAPLERPASWWWDGLWIEPIAGKSPFLAVLVPLEERMWFVGIAAYGPWEVPRDEGGFERALGALRTPLLAEAAARAEPISDVLVTRSTANHFRHFERGPTRVAGLLALGDAACSFNPIYGQGMSVAAQTALALDEVLRKHGVHDRELEARFFRAQAELSRLPWTLATGADLQFETTEGARSRTGRFIGPYFNALFRCSHLQPRVMRHIMPVFHLCAPGSQLVAPRVVAEVVRHTVRQRLGRGPRYQPARDAPLPAMTS